MNSIRFVSACLLAACLPAGNLPAAEGIEILPARVSLSTTAARQRIIVQEVANGKYLGQRGEGVEFTSSDPAIARIEKGLVIPVKNGTATITARLEGRQATAEVTVAGQKEPFEWSFRNHVESVLSKSGCNSGACHGAKAGQNGFRLTLFGFDLQADYSYLTRQARGRRVVPSDPGRSLMLTKPTGALPHRGGVRLEVNGPEYQVLSQWIAAGTPGPSDQDAIIERVEVLPEYSSQRPGNRQQLVVLAHFNDGHVEDVTRWAKYTTVNRSVATVGRHGEVEVVGPGEGAVKVWYLNLNQLAFLTVPYNNQLEPGLFEEEKRNNFIDQLVLEKLQALNIPPSPITDDATFIRRVYLDATGMIPTSEQVTQFLEDSRSSDEKRVALVDDLLERPEYVDYWSYKWSDLLLANGKTLGADPAKAYYGWIRERVKMNMPWDEFVRQLVTANGSTSENGAANFYSLHQSPEEMSETVSQAFLGLSINCARCHNHPLEKWTNDQYYGMANMFSRVRGKGSRIVFTDTQGELLQPSTGRPQPPRPLDAEAVAFDDPTDRRVYLARWLTSPENRYFSRSIANRVWANFFGVGLVEKVDDMRVTNPASNELLLDAVADYLVAEKFDLKKLVRAILTSSSYQRSSRTVEGNETDDRFYSRYYPRRLQAEVLLDAISQVTAVPTVFKDQPAGTRALQLPDSNIESYFLSTFGRPDRVITCECERSDEPSMTQVLHLYNGKTINSKLQIKENRISQVLETDADDPQVIRLAYLEVLSRLPSTEEVERLSTLIQVDDPAQRRQVLEDLYWSLLTSREFLFNH
ncbi:MAG: DUF1549 domain-containing protein [Planctomycetota bacterium]|nr:DUF1549 domain-containing protein [Planctomycetota bacterium]MEE2989273.1 DUF1549 domain-containing protein [Planctomycetota bacterium]